MTNPEVEYVRGPDLGGGVRGLLYSLRKDGGGNPDLGTRVRRYNLMNHRGDVTGKADESGTVTYAAHYEAFGKRSEEVGTDPDRQKANTKDEDPTGLLNEGFRHRDLETGTFLTRDPAGFVDGPNLYAYVRQNPWSKFDPEGLKKRVSALGVEAASKDHHESESGFAKQFNQLWKDFGTAGARARTGSGPIDASTMSKKANSLLDNMARSGKISTQYLSNKTNIMAFGSRIAQSRAGRLLGKGMRVAGPIGTALGVISAYNVYREEKEKDVTTVDALMEAGFEFLSPIGRLPKPERWVAPPPNHHENLLIPSASLAV